MLKVGLIGCGGIGAVHAQCWLSMSDVVQLVAIADVSMERAQKYAEKCGATVYADGKELLESEQLDVVDICVPTFLHSDYVLQAMDKVANVIVEKPICLGESEAIRLLEAQEQTGAFVQVAHVVRFTDAYAYLKEVMDSGKYGKMIAGHFFRISPRPNWMKGHDDVNRTGTMALDMHIHDVDYIRYLMGKEPDDILPQGVRDKNGIIQHIWTAFDYGGVKLIAEASWDYPVQMAFSSGFRVRFEGAALILDDKGILTVYPEKGDSFVPKMGELKIMDLGINVSDLGPYLNEMRYFVEAIYSKEKQGIASLSEAVASFRLVSKELELLGGARKE